MKEKESRVKINPMINSFRDYLTEASSVAYFTFGRMNPPTVGHGKLLDKLSSSAGKDPYFVFVSQSQDAKKNPLNYATKVKHVRKMFPKHARRIMNNKKVKTVFDAATSLYDQGYKNLVMVVGSDRVREFETLLNKYNGVKGRHGFYNYAKIDVVSAGARDPDAEGVEGMSASKQRENAANNDFVTFSQGIPNSMSNSDSRRLFNDIRTGMGLKEQTDFKRHIELKPVSEEREAYVKGSLFDVGDSVIVENNIKGKITCLGSNYVIVEKSDGSAKRYWLNAVQKVDEQATVAKKRDALDRVKERIKRQKARDNTKYDRALDRARLQAANKKNRTTKPNLKPDAF